MLEWKILVCNTAEHDTSSVNTHLFTCYGQKYKDAHIYTSGYKKNNLIPVSFLWLGHFFTPLITTQFEPRIALRVFVTRDRMLMETAARHTYWIPMHIHTYIWYLSVFFAKIIPNNLWSLIYIFFCKNNYVFTPT